MNIRIRKKQIKRKLAAGYPISHDELKFGIKHKMTDDIFHDPYVLFGFYATEASNQAIQAMKRIKKVALLVGHSCLEVASQLKQSVTPDVLEMLEVIENV